MEEGLRNNIEDVFIHNKKVGEFYKNMSGCLVYQTKRFEEKNQYMRIIQGFGIQAKIVERFRMTDPKGIVNIIFYKKDRTTVFYQAPVSTWLNKGMKKDFGYGEQILLPIEDMVVIDTIYDDEGGTYEEENREKYRGD